MTDQRKRRSSQSSETGIPDMPMSTPNFAHNSDHSFTLQTVMELQKTVTELSVKIDALKEATNTPEIKQDIRDQKSEIGKVKDELNSSKMWILSIFGGGFILLLGVFVAGYFRLVDHEEKLTSVVSDMRVSIQRLVDAIPEKKPN
jgi:hypothetical protein